MYEPFEWWYENRDNTNIIPTINYFSLEMSSELKWLSAISYKLFKSYNIIISPQKLQSVFKKYILGEDIIEIIKSEPFQHWLKLFEERVHFFDNIRNGYGIHKHLKEDSLSKGKWTKKTIMWDNKDGTFSEKVVNDTFVYSNPDEYHIDITDHLGLLHAEKGGDLFTAIGDFSSKYCIELRNLYNRTPVNVQQMSATSADAEYTSGGKLIIDKIIPTDRDLADNKHTPLDCNIMLSLFWPYNYNIPTYEGWDLTKIGDSHRELILNLNRDGESKASVQTVFLGQCNYFAELPATPSETVYNKIKNWHDETL